MTQTCAGKERDCPRRRHEARRETAADKNPGTRGCNEHGHEMGGRETAIDQDLQLGERLPLTRTGAGEERDRPRQRREVGREAAADTNPHGTGSQLHGPGRTNPLDRWGGLGSGIILVGGRSGGRPCCMTRAVHENSDAADSITDRRQHSQTRRGPGTDKDPSTDQHSTDRCASLARLGVGVSTLARPRTATSTSDTRTRGRTEHGDEVSDREIADNLDQRAGERLPSTRTWADRERDCPRLRHEDGRETAVDRNPGTRGCTEHGHEMGGRETANDQDLRLGERLPPTRPGSDEERDCHRQRGVARRETTADTNPNG